MPSHARQDAHDDRNLRDTRGALRGAAGNHFSTTSRSLAAARHGHVARSSQSTEGLFGWVNRTSNVPRSTVVLGHAEAYKWSMEERDSIRAALAEVRRCLRCAAVSSGVSARRVADELRTLVAEGAEVATYEGRCRDCGEYRFLLRAQPVSRIPPSPARDRIA